MTLELEITSGARAGQRERIDASPATIGRHPLCELRFDARQDLDVSTRHAELRATGDGWTVTDLGSTNGTWVNGERIAAPRALRDGDVLAFGEQGPRATVRLTTPRAGHTTERIQAAVREQTSRLRTLLVGALALLVVGAGGALGLAWRAGHRRDLLLAELQRRNDSASAAFEHALRQMSFTVSGLDSALASARAESDSLRARLAQARSAGAADVGALADQLARADSRRRAIASMDYHAVDSLDRAAVAMVFVEMADGSRYSGSGFAVTHDGLLVTNRHLVVDDGGTPARRIAVIFADTRDWLPAHIVRVGRGADLALLQLDVALPVPTVQGVADASRVAVGSPVAIIGYPLGLDTPMEGSGTKVTARATLGVGTVSKRIDDVVQVDAYAGEGSSGSPLLDARGEVVGVVYGGARDSGGRIVYAVPAERVTALLHDATAAPATP